MSAARVTTTGVRSFVEELYAAGVREVCIAPGSRSTPLVLAFAEHGSFRMRVHLDERSASFFALGVGKASGRAAVVVTTSGTAAANLLPAVVEASWGETPLLLLTADRPHHLRDSDANQSVDQIHLFGRYPRWFADMAPPSDDPAALAHLRRQAGRAVAAAVGGPAGPVHLNFPFSKPLEPEDGPAGSEPVSLPERDPSLAVSVRTARCSEEEIDALLQSFEDHPRGVIVAGPSSVPDRLGEAVVRLGAATGYPVLADPLSGARFRPDHGADVIAAYDAFLGDAVVEEALRPGLVLQVGGAPTSMRLQRFLGGTRADRHVIVDAGARWKDHALLATDYVQADAADTLARLGPRASRTVDGAWRSRWRDAESAARTVLSGPADAGAAHEGSVAGAVVGALPGGSTLVVSSSMPVRDLDTFGVPGEAELRVLANRGASGIDGVVSTAFGVAAASGGSPTVCLLGDVAFFHDQNGLLWSRESDAPVVFVLVDNDGGGIFHMLPVAEHEPHFTPYFATPHGLDFSHAARQYGIPWEDVAAEGAAEALARALRGGRTAIVRVRTDRAASHVRRREVRETVAGSVRRALG